MNDIKLLAQLLKNGDIKTVGGEVDINDIRYFLANYNCLVLPIDYIELPNSQRFTPLQLQAALNENNNMDFPLETAFFLSDYTTEVIIVPGNWENYDCLVYAPNGTAIDCADLRLSPIVNTSQDYTIFFIKLNNTGSVLDDGGFESSNSVGVTIRIRAVEEAG